MLILSLQATPFEPVFSISCHGYKGPLDFISLIQINLHDMTQWKLTNEISAKWLIILYLTK